MENDEKYTKTNEEVVKLVDEVSKVLRGIFLHTRKPTSIDNIANDSNETISKV